MVARPDQRCLVLRHQGHDDRPVIVDADVRVDFVDCLDEVEEGLQPNLRRQGVLDLVLYRDELHLPVGR